MTTVAVRRTSRWRPRLVAAIAFAGLTSSAGYAHAHMGHTESAAWQACAHAASSDACSWENESFIYRGTCLEISGGLVCVRNRPLVTKANAATIDPRAAAMPAISSVVPRGPASGSGVGRGWALGLGALLLLGVIGGYGPANSLWRGKK